jgi:hypothetical protein
MVPGQLGQKSLEDPISTEKSWAWWYIPVIPAMEDLGSGWPGQKAGPYLKNKQ